MHPKRHRLRSRLIIAILLICAACGSPNEDLATARKPNETPGTETASGSMPGAAPQGTLNPLTGLPVVDDSLLKIPAALISISHFPAIARPQSGLSFASFVYEYYITEGATRFLAVFYGQFPKVDLPIFGGCVTRAGPFVQSATVLGNFVWLDANQNGQQDPGEQGISGLCVNLYDAQGILVQRTTTDSNGYYGFNVKPGMYTVEFVRPEGLGFSVARAGDPNADSDADQQSGRVSVTVSGDDLSVDAAMFLLPGRSTAVPEEALPSAQVGPIRSGRLIYRYLAEDFKNSCLIFGSASPEILAVLPKCLIVFHQIQGGGFMLPLDELESVARTNQREKGSNFDYSVYSFSEQPPPGGRPANELRVFIAYLNQSGWFYDPLLQGYYRYIDTSEEDQAGVLHPDSDRLTARQVHAENVVVLFARHDVVTPTNLDIHLEQGLTGKAILFRDGQSFNITWSSKRIPSTPPGHAHPVVFLDAGGDPFPLKPGHTWVIVVTPETTVEEESAGKWQLTFVQPAGAK